MIYRGRVLPFGTTDTLNWIATAQSFRTLFREPDPFADRKPFYPLLNAVLDLGVDEIALSGQLLSMAASVITAVGVYLLGRQLLDRRFALLSGMAVLLHYPLLIFSVFNEPYTTHACVTVFLAHVALLAVRNGRVVHFVLAGLLAACSHLTVLWGFLFPAVVVPFVVIGSLRRWRSRPWDLVIRLAAFFGVIWLLLALEGLVPRRRYQLAGEIDSRISGYMQVDFDLEQLLVGLLHLQPEALSLAWQLASQLWTNLFVHYLSGFYWAGPWFLLLCGLVLVSARLPAGPDGRVRVMLRLPRGARYVLLLHLALLPALALPYHQRYSLHIEPLSFMLLTAGIWSLWKLVQGLGRGRWAQRGRPGGLWPSAGFAVLVSVLVACPLFVRAWQLHGQLHLRNLESQAGSHQLVRWVVQHAPEDALICSLDVALPAYALRDRETCMFQTMASGGGSPMNRNASPATLVAEVCGHLPEQPLYLIQDTNAIGSSPGAPPEAVFQELERSPCFRLVERIESAQSGNRPPGTVLLWERGPVGEPDDS